MSEYNFAYMRNMTLANHLINNKLADLSIFIGFDQQKKV